MRAQVIGGLPSDLVGSLTGLTQGRFPIHAKATYAGQLDEKRQRGRAAATPRWSSSPTTRRGIEIFARPGAPVIAVNDGRSSSSARTSASALRDAPGRLRQHLHLRPPRRGLDAPTRRRRTARERSGKPAAPSATLGPPSRDEGRCRPQPRRRRRPRDGRRGPATAPLPTKQRLFAHPNRARRPRRRRRRSSSRRRPATRLTQAAPLGFDAARLRARRRSRRARASSAARSSAASARGTDAVGAAPALRDPPGRPRRPADRPEADPRRLEAARVDRHLPRRGQEPVLRPGRREPVDRPAPAAEQGAARQRVLADPRIEIYGCGRADIRSGQIDRRVLATMLYLAASGLKPTVTSLKCGHGYLTTLRQRVRAHHRHGDGHRRDQRHHHHPRHPGPRLDHRRDDPGAAHAAGHDEAPPDHLADDVRRRRQHAGDGRPRRPHPRRLAPALRREPPRRRARSTPCSSPSSGPS